MAKKTHLKVRMVPESNPDSKFVYYAKKPTKGEKVKEKLKLKKYNPNTRKHEFFVEKKLPPHSKQLFFITLIKIKIRQKKNMKEILCFFSKNL